MAGNPKVATLELTPERIKRMKACTDELASVMDRADLSRPEKLVVLGIFVEAVEHATGAKLIATIGIPKGEAAS